MLIQNKHPTFGSHQVVSIRARLFNKAFQQAVQHSVARFKAEKSSTQSTRSVYWKRERKWLQFLNKWAFIFTPDLMYAQTFEVHLKRFDTKASIYDFCISAGYAANKQTYKKNAKFHLEERQSKSKTPKRAIDNNNTNNITIINKRGCRVPGGGQGTFFKKKETRENEPPHTPPPPKKYIWTSSIEKAEKINSI